MSDDVRKAGIEVEVERLRKENIELQSWNVQLSMEVAALKAERGNELTLRVYHDGYRNRREGAAG